MSECEHTGPACELIAQAVVMSDYNEPKVKQVGLTCLITKVPGMGGASIHCCSAFRTCKAWISGSCHKIVKHWETIY